MNEARTNMKRQFLERITGGLTIHAAVRWSIGTFLPDLSTPLNALNAVLL